MTDKTEQILIEAAAARKSIELVLGNVGVISTGRVKSEMPESRVVPDEITKQ